MFHLPNERQIKQITTLSLNMTLTVFRLLLLTHFLLLIHPLPLRTPTSVPRPAPLQQKKERNEPFLILLRVRCSLAGKFSTTTFLFLPCSVFLSAENYSLLNTIILYRSSCPVVIPLYFTLSAHSKKKKLHHHLSPAQPFSHYLTLQRPLSIHYTTTPQTGICRAEHGSPASINIMIHALILRPRHPLTHPKLIPTHGFKFVRRLFAFLLGGYI